MFHFDFDEVVSNADPTFVKQDSPSQQHGTVECLIHAGSQAYTRHLGNIGLGGVCQALYLRKNMIVW